jgi:hypothetical protein
MASKLPIYLLAEKPVSTMPTPHAAAYTAIMLAKTMNGLRSVVMKDVW